MKVILWMAMSLNGIIADEHGGEDFISHDSWLSWLETIRKVGCIIWGRKTYQNFQTWDKQYIEDIKNIHAVVISSNPNCIVEKGFELALSPQEALEMLKNEGYNDVVVTGGSILNSSFAKLSLIDEIVLNIEPVVVGKGIPLFSPDVFDLKLKLISIKRSKGKTIQLRYNVIK